MTLVQSPEGALPFSNIGPTSESIKGPSDLNGPTTVTVESDVSGLSEKIENVRFELEEHPVDVVRPIKVGIIGAGLAGITAGVLLPAKLPGLDLRIYDKNADVVCYCQLMVSMLCSKLTILLGRHMVHSPFRALVFIAVGC